MTVCETERLRLRQLSPADAEFICALLNEPSFIQNIGDRGVRTAEDAVQYIVNGPLASYARFGFGLYLVELKDTAVPIGICGLVKRDGLEDPDVGYAFRPPFWSQGYAFEAASAVMTLGREALGLKRIVAITGPDNHGSIKLLQKLGLKFEKTVSLPGHAAESMLFVAPLGF